MTYPFKKNKLICLILLGALSGGCRDKASGNGASGELRKDASKSHLSQPHLSQPRRPPAPACPTLESPRTSGTVKWEHLKEISGLVVSRGHPGVMWVHNDSGDEARVYALDFTGNHVATLELPVPARDFEDIALEPRTDGADRIYVADTGDNKSARDEGVLIHRFSEPSREEASGEFPRTYRIKQIETMRLRYPDGPRDAEALLVDPWSGQLVILTKPKMDPAEIFVVEHFVAEATPAFMGNLAQPGERDFLHLVTGADITADGRWIVVRTYDRVALYSREDRQSISAALAQKPCIFTPAPMPQAEAIGFLRPRGTTDHASASLNSLSFVTFGEGLAQPIHVYDLKIEQDPR